ncbi:hypothetical protein AKJ64_04240 [candidate division MSBL1 archaeon SCGC-AAA259E17]|uniref:Transcription regulator AsnC/Lrp ligand binding domain-containing protein n=1 Tax=candidate division MSBL1 archaeon SCGC-AAA259E17 TaxID=1698263 RepID=A0A133UCX7_9EURY|nr:hypothetical protein AKJ64_04240 [candidate division MSBL1 archaeon SCGC-AAA259E17]
MSTETSVRVDKDTYREVGLKEIFEKVAGMEEVKNLATVTGPYDIIAWLEADDIEEITGPLVDKIRAFKGVRQTLTNVVVRSRNYRIS